jgi:hypothetical protein
LVLIDPLFDPARCGPDGVRELVEALGRLAASVKHSVYAIQRDATRELCLAANSTSFGSAYDNVLPLVLLWSGLRVNIFSL